MVAGRLSKVMARRHRLRICLATGSTTRPVYRTTDVTGSPEIFLLDEFGGLPRDDPARCAAMLRRDLRGREFHSPDVDAEDPIEAAAAYRELIEETGLDLALVGLGRNGHLGMNEPGSTSDSRTRVVELAKSTASGAAAYGASVRPTWGITVGIAELLEARELWLVVTGEHKADVLRRALADPVGSDVPATFLREHPNAIVLADAAAATTSRQAPPSGHGYGL